MPGLDRRIIAQIDHESVIAHVKADIRSDFILAPHYNAIFNRAGDELWDKLKQQLRAGTYQPQLPITMSVPKERFFTRPGSILRPSDPLMYQALVDNTMEQLEEGHDRSRSFSHVPTDEEGQMFEQPRVMRTLPGADRRDLRREPICPQGGHIKLFRAAASA